MTTDTNDIRFTGTKEDLAQWEWFFREMETRGFISICEISKLYPNRGESKMFRQYFKVKLNAEAEE